VAEDNKINQKVILGMLNNFKCTPDIAENGQEALDRLAQQPYDLVLMDCQMPIMDGYEAVRLLRVQEGLINAERIPVVALTAHAADGERDKCLSSGMDDFLSKPITRPELTKTLARWLVEPNSCTIITTVNKVIADNTALPDWDEVATLKRLDNDQELLDDMIDLFLIETPNKLLELEDARAGNDLTALADAAHAIKGMAGHFCAEQLLNLTANLEHSARYGGQADFQQMTRNVTNAANSLISVLHEKRGKLL
jgi:CheY-like chemotaxis protein/HPt (histidine-containing phosphotransfer) domain-containing protein